MGKMVNRTTGGYNITWVTIADFRDMPGGGIKASKIIDELNRIKGE